MDLQLQGKKAVVTGGSAGMGKAIARQLAREGCDVAIGARSEGRLREAAMEIARETGRKIVPITVDTLDGESIRKFIWLAAEGLGGVQILANCAARVGGTIPDNMESITDRQIMKDFEEKFLGYYRCAREAAPYMKQAGWGRIINLSGGAGRTPGTAISTPARNIASVSLTKSLANTLGPFGINVNAIYPGTTITEAVLERHRQQAERLGKTIDAYFEDLRQRSVIRHLVSAEDVAQVVTFFCSPLAVSITGEAISVGGGVNADMHY
ncbi:MAG TPA: SDR family oxidoreductase [Candidatus Limnocylindrales bacterium]|nr:SDR family oxidoreductase [Candidatus Limnocylindrales bacterium]